MPTNASTAVLGAGALGLTLAYRLAQAGDRVTVIEREPGPGGLAACFEVSRDGRGEPVLLEKFYHHLFRADKAAVSLIEELDLGHRLIWPRPISAIFRDGAIHSMAPLDLLRLKMLGPVDRLRFGASGLYLKLEKGYQRLEGQTAGDWTRKWMGTRAYQVFAEPLLRQKFGEYADQVAMPWFWSRIHLRSTSLGYLQGSFQQLYDRLAERILALGGTIRFGETVQRIASAENGTVSVTTSAGISSYSRAVSTLPAAVTYALSPQIPQQFRDRYNPGPALSAHCLVLELEEQFSPAYWIAINEPGFPFLAVVEHTNYIDPEEYQGKRLMYVGNYLAPNDPLLELPAEQVLERFTPFLQRINPRFEQGWVRRLHVFTAPFAQPVVTVDFHTRIAPHTTPINNLFVANMFQIYPQDRGQNYSIAMGERIARRLISGTLR